ncbi:MAG: BspA family leucine-rich repeat surface protein [Bacteroidales bacterium]|nr:BspA family leucine-rich repeat surface protein [Bacteroidales bacterium]
MRKILSYLVLFVMTTLAAYPQSGSALLLNPHGDGNTHWQPNSQYDCGYLKARLSYLAGTTSANMVSFKRVSAAEGRSCVADNSKYYRKTCLSTSYDVNWVDFPNVAKRNEVLANGSNVDPANPTIVYAYSVPHEGTVKRYDGVDYTTQCYDVYWYSDAEHPKIVGDCFNLFQNGNKIKGVAVGSMLEDVSGIDDWDFSGVTSMRQMFANCQKLTELGFTNTKDFSNVTNIQSMFYQCFSLDIEKFQNCTRDTWLLNDNISAITSRNLFFDKVTKFKNVDFQILNKIIVNGEEVHKTLHVSNDNNYLVTAVDDPSSEVVSDMQFNMELATQIGRFTKIKWDMLYEENVSSYDIEYRKEGDETFIKMTTVDAEVNQSEVSYYDYIWNEIIVNGVYEFRVKANRVDNAEPLISNVFSLDYSASGVQYPAHYTILRKERSSSTYEPYDLWTDGNGDINLLLSPDYPVYDYVVPNDVVIVCENFTVKVADDTPDSFKDHCSSTFTNEGEIYANKDITLYSNSMSTISYSCDGVYVADNMTLYGYKQPFQGIFQVNEKFLVKSNGQGQDLTIEPCARIMAYEGNFEHSGGQMVLHVDGDLIVEVLVEGNVVKVENGGMLIIGQTDLDPSLRIIGLSGSLIRLCKNPTLNGKDFMGYSNGTIYYNCNPDDYGWSPANNPIGERDVNDITDPAYSSCSSLFGGVELNPTVLAVYHSYSACLDPTYDPVALGMEDDPFLPKEKKIESLYETNPCSKDFEGEKIFVRELGGGTWLRVINGELIYCENDNPQR